MKLALKFLLKKLGYRLIKQPKGIPDALLCPLEQERTSSEYDSIWSEKGFVADYLGKERLGFYHELYEYLHDHLDMSIITSIVDMGCGPGYLLKLFAELTPPARLVGLDLSDRVLASARRVCPSGSFYKHDIYEEIDDTFDLALCSEVLEHLDYPDKALDQLVKSARVIVLTVPNGRLDNYPGHINYWSKRSWEIFLKPYLKCWGCEIRFLCGQKKMLTIMRRT